MKILSKKVNSITIAAFLVAISSLLSRLLGVIRDRILAGTFGVGDALDVYYAAFRIPDLVFNLFVLGAMSAGFIPVFMSLLQKEQNGSDRESWDLVKDLINTLILGIGFLSLLGFIFAEPITKLISPGFSPEKQKMVADLTRIMFLSPILLGISSIFSGVLQSFKYFLAYSIAPILYNIGIIIGALFFTNEYGVIGLAWGVVLGAFLHMVVQLPVIFKLGFKYSFSLNLKNNNLRQIGKIMIPRTLSLGVSQLNLLVMTIIATALPVGSLAVYNLANNLQFFPVGIFGISFSIAAFPALARYANENDELIRRFSQVFRKILFFIIPATVLMIVLRYEIVELVLGTGKFSQNDSMITSKVLLFFILSLFAQSTIPLLTRMFYVKQNTKTPLYIAFFSTILAVFLSMYLPKLSFSEGVSGLALAFSISTLFNFILVWFFLSREIGNLDVQRIKKTATKMIIAAFMAGIVAYSVKIMSGLYFLTVGFFPLLFQSLSVVFLSFSVYVLICSFMRIDEVEDFSMLIKGFFIK